MKTTTKILLPSILAGLSTGSAWSQEIDFEPRVGYPTTSSGTRSVAVGDFDGDSDLDLATANEYWNEVSVLWNQGQGTFGAAQRYAVGERPDSIRAADMDGDEDLDLLTADFGSDRVTLLFNNGTGVFGAAQSTVVAIQPSAIGVADMDGDLDRDVVVVHWGSGNVLVLFNDGAGNLSLPSQDWPIGETGFPGATRMELGDFDSDGDTDVVTLNRAEYTISVLRNRGDATFDPASSFDGGLVPDSFAAADLDQDGDLDLAVGQKWYYQSAILLNQGQGAFGPPVYVGAVDYPESVTAADFDHDGDPDLAFAGGANIVAVLPNLGGASFGPKLVFAAGGSPLAVIAPDLDGDGWEDLVTADASFPPTVSVLINARVECPAPASYCTSAANSAGSGSRIGHTGSTSVGANDFGLVSTGNPPDQAGLFFMGKSPAQIAFGNGHLCVTGGLTRFPIAPADAAGVAALAVDNTIPPALGKIVPLSTWYWQYWYRDPMGGGSLFNLSNGLSATYCP